MTYMQSGFNKPNWVYAEWRNHNSEFVSAGTPLTFQTKISDELNLFDGNYFRPQRNGLYTFNVCTGWSQLGDTRMFMYINNVLIQDVVRTSSVSRKKGFATYYLRQGQEVFFALDTDVTLSGIITGKIHYIIITGRIF